MKPQKPSTLEEEDSGRKKMHDTIQLRKACEKDPIISQHFKGVFAADQIPMQKLSREMGSWSIIMNTDPLSKPGQHWVAVLKKDNKCYFFDSYGQAPTKYQPDLWKPFSRCERNQKDYQQTLSTVCGDYCIFFLRLFSTPGFKTDFKHLDNYFDEHRDEENDQLVHKVVHDWHPRILNEELHNQFLQSPVRGSGQRGGFKGVNVHRLFFNQMCVARQ